MERSIQAMVINAKAFFLFNIIVVTIGTILTIVMANISVWFIPIGLIVFWFGPLLIFQRRLRKPFLKNTTFYFSDERILINISTNNLPDKEVNLRYNQIESFRVYNSAKDDSSFLKISCKNGSSYSYTIVGQTNEDGDLDITENVTKYIHKYNFNQPETSKIKLIPSLFASKKGTIYIYMLTTILICLFIFQIYFKPKTIPATIFASLFLTLQIIAQRKKDVKDLERFNSTDINI